MSLLEMKHVSRTYQPSGAFPFSLSNRRLEKPAMTRQALKPLSLALEAGQTLGIIGESGAGKTTLARLAAGLENPSTGEVMLDSRPAHSLGRQRARIVQMVWQDARGSLDPRFKVERTIAEPLRVHGILAPGGIKERVGALLDEVGLEPALLERYPHQLSGGEAQRVVIARALALEPRLLICDEPASALDIRTKLMIADLLRRLRQERNLAMMVVAHDLFLVRRLADEVMVMKDGEVVEKGPAPTVLLAPENAYTRQLIASEPVMKASPADRRQPLGPE